MIPYRSLSDRFHLALPALAVGLSLVAGCDAPGPTADLVVRGGKIVTLDPQRPTAEALAVVGDRISAVGSLRDVAPWVGAETRVIELEGAIAVPGFIESHGHFLDFGMSQMTLDLVGTTSPEEIGAQVVEASKRMPEGEWLIGRGWDQNDWPVKQFPDHGILDRAAPDRPVFLHRVDMHAGWANGRAMALAGIERATADPAGGEIVRDSKGNPTGIFIDRAVDLITSAIPSPSAESQREAIRLAEEACFRNGVTSFHDAGVDEPIIELYRALVAQGALRLRLYVMLNGRNPELLQRYFAHRPELGPHLSVRSVKLMADGALGSRGAALLEDYSDRPGWKGLMILEGKEIYSIADRALRAGYQLNVHAIGDRANRETLDAFERALGEHSEVRDPRFRVEHAQILDAADIPRFAQLGVIASMQGVHATSDRPWVADRIGEERTAEGAYVWQKLLRTGARIANGTDAPVERLSPIECFYASVTRKDRQGQPEGGWDPGERMSREEALRSYTVDAAYAAFEESEKGSLGAGKLADLVVLSRDIMTIEADEILGTEVLYTMVGGTVVYEKQ
jgi:hypothetical protein